MVDKKISFLLSVFVVAILASVYFAFATVYVQPAHLFQFVEDNQSFYNITINHTGGLNINNISQVNITFLNSSVFTYIANSNQSRTNATSANTNFVYNSTTETLSWNSSSPYLINGTGNYSWFAFNASVATPGIYTLQIMTLNGTGPTYNNVTVEINDTTVPEVQAGNFTSPIILSNHSGLLVLNVTVLDNGQISRLFFNVTNSSGAWNGTYYASNPSGNFWNATVNTSNYAEGLYNVTVQVNDTYNNVNNSAKVYSVRFDNTVPEVQTANITSPVVTSNYSQTLLLNVSVIDLSSSVGAVFFNITNSSGSWNGTYYASNPSSGSGWNITINTTSHPDGVYNVTVYANDTAGNLNTTARISNIIIDNTVPSIGLTSSSVTKNSLTLTVTITDTTATSSGTCASDRDGAGASVTGSGASRTLTESGLNCGTTYSYIVGCADGVGNEANSASTSFTTSSCSGGSSGGGGGGGGSTTTWANTFSPSDTQLEGGYTKKLKQNNRVQVKVGGTTHYVGVKSLTDTTATIEVASTPVTATLGVGQEKKFDVDSDGFYDLSVKLNSVSKSNADITIMKINEPIPTTSGSEVSPSGSDEGVTAEEPQLAPEEGVSEGSSAWIWILVLLIIIAIVAAIIYNKRK